MAGRPRVALCAAVIASFLAGSARAQTTTDTTASRATSWLLAHQDGSTGAFHSSSSGAPATGEDELVVTSEAVRALAAAGGSSSAIAAGRLHLLLTPVALADERAHRLVALRGSSYEDSAGEQALLAEVLADAAAGRSGPAFGSGFEAGSSSATPLEAAAALEALVPPGDAASANATQAEASRLLAAQLPSYGWSVVDDDGDLATTARVVAALAPFRFLPTFPGPLNNAVTNAILPAQNGNGSFGDGSQPDLDTALALLAFNGIGSPGPDTSTAANNAVTFLSSSQLADGSWGEDAYTTAVVLRALALHRPDWASELDERGSAYLSVSNLSPFAGETVHAAMVVVNRSPTPAQATTVRFTAIRTAGGAPITLGEAPLAALDGGATGTAALDFNTAGFSGSYLITATVDPDNLVPELSETNNSATAIISVVHAQDLAISATDITFALGTSSQLTITANVHNVGDPITTPFQVSFYEGNPASQGKLLGSTSIGSMTAGATAPVTQAVDASKLGGATPYFVVVDSTNQIVEAREDNNQAYRYYEPGTAQPVDLVITTSDVVLTPTNPGPNDPTTVTFTVHNQAVTVSGISQSHDATDVAVRFTDSSGAVVALLRVGDVPANGSAQGSFTAYFPQSTTLTATVDPYSEQDDLNRNNNQASKAVTIGSPLIDLAVTALTARYNSELDATVTSLGQQGGSSTVTFYEGDPDTGSAVVLATRSVGFGPQSPYQQPATVTVTGLALKTNTVYVACVDAAHALSDSNFNNNCFETLNSGPGSTGLAVTTQDIQLSVLGPDIGEAVTLSATVHNTSSTAGSTLVRLWRGVPRARQSAVIGEKPLTVAANSTAIAQFPFVRAGVESNYYVELADVVPGGSDSAKAVAATNLYLEAFVDTGRRDASNAINITMPVVGDLFGLGTPDIVLGEIDHVGSQNIARVTVMQLHADHTSSQVWSQILVPGSTHNTATGRPLLADLDSDGKPEIVVGATINTGIVVNGATDTQKQLDVFEPDGTLKWSAVIDWAQGPGYTQTGIGDVSGDGVLDVISVDTVVRAFDGRDGTLLWTSAQLAGGGGEGNVIVADVDGDGWNEVFVTQGGFVTALNHLGVKLWQANVSPWDSLQEEIALADLDGDGRPEIIAPLYSGCCGMGNYVTFDAVTGQVVKPANWNGGGDWQSVTVGDFRQNGLRYLVDPGLGDSSLHAFQPDGTGLWVTTTDTTAANYHVSLADLLGRGRPQVVAYDATSRDGNHGLTLVDSRSGEVLINSTAPSGYATFRAPVVADIDGDGHGDVIEPFGTPYLSSYSPPGWTKSAEFIVYGSAHWQPMPTRWNSGDYVQGAVDAHLKPTPGFKSWLGTNTWNDQFITEPSHLLPDLVVSWNGFAVSPSLPAAGTPATVTVTVQNQGGVAATNPTVDLYDGDPDAGGTLIGSATVAATLAPVTMVGGVITPSSGTVSIPWTPYPDGAHQLYAVVNGAKAIEESGYENNEANARVLVGQGTNLSDVAVVGGTGACSPVSPFAGTPATLSATVINNGPLSSGAFSVAFYDGVPAADGSNLIGEAPSADLASGAQQSVLVSWLPLPGGHEIYVVVDPEGATLDSNRGNNTTFFDVTSPAEDAPDLTVAARDMSASPSPAVVGQVVTLSALVRNLGTAVDATSVAFYSGDPAAGGALLAQVPVNAHLEPGQSFNAQTTFTPTAAGSLTLYAVVDPDNAIAEASETNNSASITETVVAGTVAISAATDQSSYGANQLVQATASISNSASVARTFTVDLSIASASGATLATLARGATVVVAAGQTGTTSAMWSTGASVPATYFAKAVVHESGAVVGTAQTAFTVTPDVELATELVTDQTSYIPGDSALLSQRLTNNSANADLRGISSVLTVSQGTTVLLQQVRQIPLLAQGQTFEAYDLFAVSSALAPDTYPATVSVYDANNVLLASAQASVTVVAPTPAQALRATLTADPTQFGPGQGSTLTVTLTNTGNVEVDTPVDVQVFDETSPPTLESDLNNNNQQLQLAAGASTTLTYAWTPPATMPYGEKLATVNVGGTVLARTLVDALDHSPDTTPPVVTITGVFDGELTNQTVTPTVTVTDASPFSATLTLDGQPFNSGTPVAAEGDHVLVVDAVDLYSNATHVEVRFSIDLTPPQVSYSGVTDGSVVDGPLTPTFSATDDRPGVTVSATLNGAPFTSGTTLTAEADYTLVITALDSAGNSTSTAVTFAIDDSPPVITVSGVSDGELTNQSVTPSFTVSDAHLASFDAALDGAPFTSDSTVYAEGDHVLVVSAVDLAGNSASTTVHFTIDLTAPVITVSGVSDGELTNAAVTITFSSADTHPGTTTATLDGADFASGTTVSTEGTHVLVVNATDAAGNAAAPVTIHFTQDFTPPVIAVSGVTDGELTNQTLTITFDSSDTHPGSTTATLDGQPFTSGSTYHVEGDHTLVVNATDAAGNAAGPVTIHFTQDFTAPVISVSGVTEGEITNQPVTPTFTVTEAHPGTTSATLDGAVFTSGTGVDAEGDHVLVVSSTDGAGNSASSTVHFTLDFTAPAIAISGVSDGEVTDGGVTPVVAVTDLHLAGSSVTLDADPFTSGTPVYTEGSHLLEVAAVDLAGNDAGAEVYFSIDTLPPDINVTGVEEGATYFGNAPTPAIAISDPHLDPAATVVTLDGQPYTSGTPVTAPGDHVLYVYAADILGHTSSVTVHFTYRVDTGLTLTSGEASTGRVLVDLSCATDGGACPGAPVTLASLEQAGLAYDVAQTDGDFLTLLRENEYRAYVLHQATQLGSSLAAEIGEHVNEGTGLLYLRSSTLDDPFIRPVLGSQTLGVLNGITSVALSGGGTLAVGGTVANLKPLGATAFATAVSGSHTYPVATRNFYGTGRALYVGFDPEVADSSAMRSELAALATEAVSGSPPPRVPLSIAELSASVNNDAPVDRDFKVLVTLPSGSQELYATPTLSSTSPMEWVSTVAAGQTDGFDLGFRTTDTSGQNTATLELDALINGTDVWVATNTTSFPVASSGSQLLSNAVTQLQALAVSASDAAHRDAAEADLNQLVNAPVTAADAAGNVGLVLSAVSELLQVKNVSVTGVRLSLDGLLRYQENQYSNLRGWP